MGRLNLSTTNMTRGDVNEMEWNSRAKVRMKKSNERAEIHSQTVDAMCKFQPPSLPGLEPVSSRVGKTFDTTYGSKQLDPCHGIF